MIDNDRTYEYSPIELVQFSSKNQLTIYPTPSNAFFNIELEQDEWIERLEIYNVLGQLVYSEVIGRVTNLLDIHPQLLAGAYNLLIIGKDSPYYNSPSSIDKCTIRLSGRIAASQVLSSYSSK